jgi:two-component system cell cycle response regulator
MTARILVVDDIHTNRRLLEGRLSAEYFEVATAASGEDCLRLAREFAPDLILLDVMMPGMNGYDVCRRLKGDGATAHIPVVMITALDQREERLSGLQAGADEFLTKPVDDVALFARVRSLLRLKLVMDELRQRQDRVADGEAPPAHESGLGGAAQVVVAAGDDRTARRLAAKLPSCVETRAFGDPAAATAAAREGADMVLIDLTGATFDGLRVVARIRSEAASRNIPILAVIDADNALAMVRALDMGVNDVVCRPVDAGEIAARTATQLRRKRYADQLRDRLDESLEMAFTDALTGLPNRRYVMARLREGLEGLDRDGEAVSVAVLDIDRFKPINDTYGHLAGDRVLRGMAERMGASLRASDVAGRFGGEEFLIVMRGADEAAALDAAERVRAALDARPFIVRETGEMLTVTLSAGVAQAVPGETAEALIARADAALYAAKAAGRNRVMADRKKAA